MQKVMQTAQISYAIRCIERFTDTLQIITIRLNSVTARERQASAIKDIFHHHHEPFIY